MTKIRTEKAGANLEAQAKIGTVQILENLQNQTANTDQALDHVVVAALVKRGQLPHIMLFVTTVMAMAIQQTSVLHQRNNQTDQTVKTDLLTGQTITFLYSPMRTITTQV